MHPIQLEPFSEHNLRQLAAMAAALWPDSSIDEELKYYAKKLKSGNIKCILAKIQEEYTGFIHLSLRNDYVEGTSTRPVGYIEGIYVSEAFRKQGIGQQLVMAGENWCREQGCTEYASDAELTNPASIAFHQKAGFNLVNRVACFARPVSK